MSTTRLSYTSFTPQPPPSLRLNQIARLIKERAPVLEQRVVVDFGFDHDGQAQYARGLVVDFGYTEYAEEKHGWFLQVKNEPRFSLHSVFCVNEPNFAATLPHPPLTDLILMLQLSPRAHLRPNRPSKH